MKAFALAVDVDQITKSIVGTMNFPAQYQDVKRQKRSRCQILAVQSAVCVSQAFSVFCCLIVFLN